MNTEVSCNFFFHYYETKMDSLKSARAGRYYLFIQNLQSD